ncbi:MAG: VanZ family protein [Hyphomonadaceae bacterium]
MDDPALPLSEAFTRAASKCDCMASLNYVWKALFGVSLLLVAFLTLTPPGPPSSLSFLSDKAQHFSAFAWLALLGAFAFRSNRSPLVLCVLLPAYGAAIEIAQNFVPGRTPEVADWIADTLGTVAALGMVLLSHRLRARRTAR